MKTLLIISHTEHYIDSNGNVVGWGPTVTEINHLTKIFKKIIHLAPLHKGVAPLSTLHYTENVEFNPLKPSGGNFFKKLTIFYNAPHNLIQVQKYIKKVEIIQFRAPTGIGIYILPFLKHFNNKPYWIKYAGNWVSENMPLGNKTQKWWLKNKLSSKTKITVNGIWNNKSKNIIAFENPCLNENDRVVGKISVEEKKLSPKINYCFVGGLNINKGIELLLNVFDKINSDGIGILHVVGDGHLRSQLETIAKQITFPVIFHGVISKDEIISIYKRSHYIVLPSQSEGFPKVIGEAMNYGCVPIVSDISCINQYVQNDYNGFLINPLTANNLTGIIYKSLLLSSSHYKKYINLNYLLAEKFTYDYYLKMIKKKILD